MRRFAEHPLRRLKPLPLINGYMQVGQLKVLLDKELGLLYQKGEGKS